MCLLAGVVSYLQSMKCQVSLGSSEQVISGHLTVHVLTGQVFSARVKGALYGVLIDGLSKPGDYCLFEQYDRETG